MTTFETLTCHKCGAVYMCGFRAGPSQDKGRFVCEVCQTIAVEWDGSRSYSDFTLIVKPKDWKP